MIMDQQDSDSPQAQEENVHQETTAQRKKSNRSPPYALFNLLVILTAIAYGAYHQMYLSKEVKPEDVETSAGGEDDLQKIPLFTAEQLKKFDGISKYWKLKFHVNPNMRTSI